MITITVNKDGNKLYRNYGDDATFEGVIEDMLETIAIDMKEDIKNDSIDNHG